MHSLQIINWHVFIIFIIILVIIIKAQALKKNVVQGKAKFVSKKVKMFLCSEMKMKLRK